MGRGGGGGWDGGGAGGVVCGGGQGGTSVTAGGNASPRLQLLHPRARLLRGRSLGPGSSSYKGIKANRKVTPAPPPLPRRPLPHPAQPSPRSEKGDLLRILLPSSDNLHISGAGPGDPGGPGVLWTGDERGPLRELSCECGPCSRLRLAQSQGPLK
ncbi:hypothetical protein AAFF_G00275440 [Aldrovandia affinis]|uniref:Uncharacterized protein n=1 Tax=Aldrovandia affinis TaxID=143900 RepID=A0AAD7SRU7_9TELE|nr:hypothetical protein AAFF_G00275440 [Aldrovandia affinis]